MRGIIFLMKEARKILDKITTLEPDYTKKFSRAEIINTSHNDVEACQKIPDFLFDFIAMSTKFIVTNP